MISDRVNSFFFSFTLLFVFFQVKFPTMKTSVRRGLVAGGVELRSRASLRSQYSSETVAAWITARCELLWNCPLHLPVADLDGWQSSWPELTGCSHDLFFSTASLCKRASIAISSAYYNLPTQQNTSCQPFSSSVHTVLLLGCAYLKVTRYPRGQLHLDYRDCDDASTTYVAASPSSHL